MALTRQTGRVPVIELRQYTLLPEKRNELIGLFDDHFTEAQEHCGIDVIGTFRDLSDRARFVWVRGFPDMDRRERALREFYGGPVWRRHRDAANATMIDSDNVLLLRPAWSDSTFPPNHPPSAKAAGLVQAGIVGLREPGDADDIVYFGEHVVPAIEAGGGRILACLVTEQAENNFPSLPVREGENVFVWFAGFSEAEDRRVVEAAKRVAQSAESWPGCTGEHELLLLAPTCDSRLNGNSEPASGGRRKRASV